jgi:penicillin-binding protein 2
MNDHSPLRLAMVGILVLGLFASLFARLWYLQVATEQRVEAQTTARQNLFRTVYTTAPRGRVLDRNDNVLIDNRLVNEVVIDKFTLNESLPRSSQQREFTIKLAREISSAGRLIKAADIEAALVDPRYGPFDVVPIVKAVPERFSILIGEREDDFPGVEVRKANVRFYPYGQRAAHLLGYVGAINAADFAQVRDSSKLYQPTDEIGIAGVEDSFEDILRGTPQVEVIEVDAAGVRIAVLSTAEAVPGNDVRLTLDINLQALVEEELAEGIRSARQQLDETNKAKIVPYNAPGGAMVLLDPDGSRILAMASYPTYDQRLFLGGISQRSFDLLDADDTKPLFDRATQAGYAPGSTFKLITAYAALDAGLLGDRGFLKRKQFLLDEGTWVIPGCEGPGCVLRNAGDKPLGDVDLELAITKSSNVFFGQLGYQFNVRQGFQSQQLIDVAEDFGYGLNYSALPNANAGQVPPPATAGESANMAVGQGFVLATPLQMANSYAAIANRGLVYSPMLAEAVIDAATNEVLIEFPTRLIHELYMPDEFYEPLVRGLRGVTEAKGGTAVEAFETFPENGFSVCGKTGTVENPPKQDNAAFAAFAPCNNPQYATVTYIEQAGLGGDAAAPVVAAVLGRIATGDIDVVPTEAEADDLISEADAIAAEEARLQSETEVAAAAAEAANPDGPSSFEVLVPKSDDEGTLSEEGDVLVLISDDEAEAGP